MADVMQRTKRTSVLGDNGIGAKVKVKKWKDKSVETEVRRRLLDLVINDHDIETCFFLALLIFLISVVTPCEYFGILRVSVYVLRSSFCLNTSRVVHHTLQENGMTLNLRPCYA